ncbi:MAG TPA: sialidase family protein [Capsulimonadaceae bacterium]|jgi:predicted neuraminidase
MFELNGNRFQYEPSVIFHSDDNWQYGREPILRRLPDGSLVSLIYAGGPSEPHDENVVLITRSVDDGATWTKPEILFSHDARGVWATEMFTEGPRPFIIFYTLDAASHYLDLHAFRSFYDSATATWTEPSSMPSGLHSVNYRQGVVLADGSWLFPVYWEEVLTGFNWQKEGKGFKPHDGWQFIAGAVRSEDQGKTFSNHGYLKDERFLWEPNLVEVSPNHIVMLMRAEGTPWKYRSESLDGGRTWSPAVQSDIPCANSKITLLKWGERTILIHNPSDVPGWDHRTSLEIWVSDDGCKTWPIKRVLAKAVAPKQVLCYPHGFIDQASETLYVAIDGVTAFYLCKVPLADLS